ncbi:MAG TPA: TRAM domain-containing protein [Candidatus Saccharimonadales bacterium]|jgi:uncharacterized protein YacL|nr:TRAM domain-containing protein [Candidatus Saccharimonadales bacterium]
MLISQRMNSSLPWFAANKRRRLILDSCGLIDGRIVDLARTGFIADELIIPQFILSELQLLADGNDSHKRERARFGLDIAKQLQDEAAVTVTIDRTVLQDVRATDDKLVALAKKMNASLYTTDFNLNKVAAVEDVRVLNVNELAQNLRPVSLPGETLKIKIVQKGSNPNQGVGYLEDGTMIVVDGAARYINRTVDVTVSRMHQTVAGKMVFGQMMKHSEHDGQSAPAAHSAPASQRQQAASAAVNDKLHARLVRHRRPAQHPHVSA